MKKAMIMLHGRGGTAQDILNVAPLLCDDSFYVTAPQAPNNTWYPRSFMEDNEPYLSQSIQTVKSLIDEIAEKIPREQIYLMGFSQGACLSLEIAARFPALYGGILAFSGALIGKEFEGNLQGTKIFIGVSEEDPFIPLVRSQASKEILEEMGAEVSLMSYPGNSHKITDKEIQAVKKWFNL